MTIALMAASGCAASSPPLAHAPMAADPPRFIASTPVELIDQTRLIDHFLPASPPRGTLAPPPVAPDRPFSTTPSPASGADPGQSPITSEILSPPTNLLSPTPNPVITRAEPAKQSPDMNGAVNGVVSSDTAPMGALNDPFPVPASTDQPW